MVGVRPTAASAAGTAGAGAAAAPAGTTALAPQARHDEAPDGQLARSRVIKTLQPGQPGTGRWQHTYGDRLVCVRYREDLARGERHLTVELVLETRPLVRRPAPLAANPPLPKPDPLVSVRIGISEIEARAQAKRSGGHWDPQARLWRVPLAAVEQFDWWHRAVRSPKP